MASPQERAGSNPQQEQLRIPESLLEIKGFLSSLDSSIRRYLSPEKSPFLEDINETPDLVAEVEDIQTDWDNFIGAQGAEFLGLMEKAPLEDADLIQDVIENLQDYSEDNARYLEQLEELPEEAIEALGGTAEEFVKNTLEKNLTQPQFNSAEFNDLVEHAMGDPELLPHIQKALEKYVGEDLSRQLIEDASYRAELIDLQEALEERIAGNESNPESGAPLMEHANIAELIRVHDIFGSNPGAMADAFNMAGIRPELGLSIQEKPVLVADGINVSMEMIFTTPEGEECLIRREFFKKVKRNGEVELIVNHDYFELPNSLQGDGLGKELLKKSLEQYDEIGVDAITLQANIAVGGYAWAKYGVGWDLDIAKSIAGSAENYISNVISDIHEKALNTISALGLENSPEATALLATYQSMEHNAAGVTPQDLAELGKEITVVIAENGAIYSESDPNAPSNSRKMSIGKYAMLGADWMGKITIKADQDGAIGPNREIFESYLQKP